MVEGLSGFLPPGATAANVVALLGSLRTNEFSILDAQGMDAVGVGCYPRAALVNHSCAPNCILSSIGMRMRVTLVSPVAAGEELCPGGFKNSWHFIYM